MKFFDKNGIEIREFAVLKFFHFIGARKKKHYMYKWARIVNGHLVCNHLVDANPDSWCSFRGLANPKTGVIADCEIVQQYDA